MTIIELGITNRAIGLIKDLFILAYYWKRIVQGGGWRWLGLAVGLNADGP
jgi:hypothetical protein